MTFTVWYDANVKPPLEESLKSIPILAREAVRAASRKAMAACWNAALDAVCQARFTRDEFPPPCGLPAEIREQIMEMGA